MILNIAYDIICYIRYESITSYTISYTTSYTISLSLFLCYMWTGSDVLDPAPEWMLYEYRTAHPVLRWLPTKLAEWIGANLSEELLIPDKIEDKWSAAELNSILLNNVVWGPYGHLHTFGGIQWECGLFNERLKARCYPFNIVGHRFQDKNPQVALQYHIRCRIRCRI
jgi:hypothetical protein